FAALTGNPAQNLAIELDYNTGGIEYIVNGVTVQKFTNFNGVAIGSFQLSTSGGSGSWSSDNIVSVNSMGLSMIPEPSTGSMILLGMGGLAAVRLLRRKVS
ncbi:MAG: PEP-CTERM sorting domain-containing protein, partial [Verrucomicrobia bacterium]|nr:PEP-CTERM sorting domain-containing protein [Verrucomicrobiota bacterium]